MPLFHLLSSMVGGATTAAPVFGAPSAADSGSGAAVRTKHVATNRSYCHANLWGLNWGVPSSRTGVVRPVSPWKGSQLGCYVSEAYADGPSYEDVLLPLGFVRGVAPDGGYTAGLLLNFKKPSCAVHITGPGMHHKEGSVLHGVKADATYKHAPSCYVDGHVNYPYDPHTFDSVTSKETYLLGNFPGINHGSANYVVKDWHPAHHNPTGGPDRPE